MKSLFIGLLTSLLTLSNVNASTWVPAENIWTSNIYAINQDKIMDGILFDEMLDSTYDSYSGSIWWSGSGSITIDFGTPFILQDVLIQADANDYYQVDYSMDDINWSSLFTINPEDGDLNWGLDTMSSDNQREEYVDNIDFSAIETRFLRISASAGDNIYFLSEIQAFGNLPTIESSLTESQTVSPVPAPPSVMLFGAGLMMLMGLQYRRKRQLNQTLST